MAISKDNPTPDDRQSVGEGFDLADVDRELDALLTALARSEPQAPQLTADEFNSIAGIISEIVVNEPITHTQQLLQELNAARSQLVSAQTELQFLQQRNQVQADRIDASAVRVQHLKSRTQQLAQQSQSQIDRAQEQLAEIERIRTEIVTSLERFGDWEEIQTLVVRLEAARQALEIDRDRITDRQQAFYDSLEAMRSRVEAIEHKFGELESSIGTDKEQFYALTAEAIDKADEIRTQLASAFQQINDDRQTLVELNTNLTSLQQTVRKEAQQKLINFDRRDRELIALCNDLKSRHKDAALIIKKQSIWLWVLSTIVSVLFMMIIRLAI